MQRLTKSVAQVLREDEGVQEVYRYSWLKKRLRVKNPRIGIGQAVCLTDRCPDSRCWDAVVEPAMYRDLEETLEHMLWGDGYRHRLGTWIVPPREGGD